MDVVFEIDYSVQQAICTIITTLTAIISHHTNLPSSSQSLSEPIMTDHLAKTKNES